ncbi:hypothetical protein STENM223S_01224 [Streptomyces tendae]
MVGRPTSPWSLPQPSTIRKKGSGAGWGQRSAVGGSSGLEGVAGRLASAPPGRWSVRDGGGPHEAIAVVLHLVVHLHVTPGRHVLQDVQQVVASTSLSSAANTLPRVRPSNLNTAHPVCPDG